MAELQGFVCSHVFADVRPVLLVARDAGDWMFMCGDTHPEDEDYHLIGVNHLTQRDPSLREILDLSDGSAAERKGQGERWIFGKFNEGGQ